MKKSRTSTLDLRQAGGLDAGILHCPDVQPPTASATTIVMREWPALVDVEEILSSRAIARTEIRHPIAGVDAADSPRRLRSIMEQDVDVVTVPKSDASRGWPNDVNDAPPAIRDFLLTYARDYLHVERRFAHFSFTRLLADTAVRRAALADALPPQIFAVDPPADGCHRCASKVNASVTVMGQRRYSALSNDCESSDSLIDDIIINALSAKPSASAQRSVTHAHLPAPIFILFSKTDENGFSTIPHRRRPPAPDVSPSARLHLRVLNLSLNPCFEPLFLSAALYDVRRRQKISETVHFDVNDAPHVRQLLPVSSGYGAPAASGRDALFAVSSSPADLADVFLVFRLEKVLQASDLSECVEPYVRDVKNRDKLATAATDNCQRLGAYRMPLGWMAVDLTTVVESALRSAESSVKVSADDELSGAGPQDDTISIISVDRLSMTTMTIDSVAAAPSTLRGAAENPPRVSRGSNLRSQFSITSVAAADINTATVTTNSSGEIFDALLFMQHVAVNINSFYKQEYDRLSDEELLEMLAGCRRGFTAGSVGAGARLKTFPADLRIQLAGWPSEAVARSHFGRWLSPEFNGVAEHVTDGAAPTVRDVLVFGRPNTFSINHFYRNLLYVYPKWANLSTARANNAARNICVRVQVRDAAGAILPLIYERDGTLVDSYSCSVAYHCKTPQFADEIKICLPLAVQDGYHILFSFWHVSCKAAGSPTENLETLVGYTWLPLRLDGMDGVSELPAGDFSLPISADALPAGLCYLSPTLNVPSVRWLDGHRPLFGVSLRLVSTIYPQDHHLSAFFRAYDALRGSSQADSATEARLHITVANLTKARPEPLVAFLYIVLDKLLALISCPPFPDMARSCFETLCQLIKVGTMLLDAGNVDELGRSQLFAAYVYHHKLTQTDLLCSPRSGGTLCEQIEAAAAATLVAGRRQNVSRDNISSLIESYERRHFYTDRLKDSEDWPNRKLLHEEIMYQFASAAGAVHETACLYAWFFFELTLKAMAEHLAARNRFFLPRRLRFRDEFHRSVNSAVRAMTAEILERAAPPGAGKAPDAGGGAPARQLNAALAFFLRDALLFMDRTFVLRQAKLYHDEMAERINSASSPAIQAALTSLKLAFFRILCSHEHFLFLNLPFERRPSAAEAPFACSSTAGNDQPANELSTDGSSKGDLDAAYLSSHFPLAVVLTDVAAILSSSAGTSTFTSCLEEAVQFVASLLASHEADARLAVDSALRQRVAALYLPLVGVLVDAADRLYDPFRDGIHGGGELASGKISDDFVAPDDGGVMLGKEITRTLLISFCWVIANVDRTALARYVGGAAPTALCRLVDLLQLSVSLFEHRQSSAPQVAHEEVEVPLTRGKSISVLVASSTIQPQPHSLSRKLSYGTQSIASGLGNDDVMVNSLVEFSSYGNDLSTCHYCKDGALTRSTSAAPSRSASVVRWRSNEQLLIKAAAAITAASTPTKTTASTKLNRESETRLQRQLSIEVCFAALATVETMIELAETPFTAASLRFIVPMLIQLLTHMMSCNVSVDALANIFRIQRRVVAGFPELIFEQKMELCTWLCYQLLRHMGSRLSTIRSQAAGSFYLLLRHSFLHSRSSFARVKMQVTLALSTLVNAEDNNPDDEDGDQELDSIISDSRTRRSLRTVLDYMEADLRTVTAAKNVNNDNFSEQVKSLASNLQMIVKNSARMQLYAGDFEMLVDLMYRIAKGYQNNPDLRITWLLNIAGKHLERDNYMEAAHCALHCAALVAEYLTMRAETNADALPASADAFVEISGNVMEESTVSDDVIPSEEESVCESSHFTIGGFVRLIEKCLIFFERAQAYELISPLYKLILPIFERQNDHQQLTEVHRKLAESEKRIDVATPAAAIGVYEHLADPFALSIGGSDKRCFGTYFRVGFYGYRFGEELNGVEFIYKEPSITKLSEISHRLEAFYAERLGGCGIVEIIKDSSDVDPSQLNEDKAYIQVTYVEPYFEEWDRHRRTTHFRRQYALDAFAYATPFTAGGRPHGLLAEQFKRRTVLRTHNSFPYMKTRLRVVAREQHVLAPIQVAIEDIEKKTRELASATALQPPDAKILQMFLQGCIGTTVNVGPIQIAKVFLRPDESCSVPSLRVMNVTEFRLHQDRLRLCFKDFARRCHDALCVNATLIDAERADYQNELRKNYADFTAQLSEILAANDRPAAVTLSLDVLQPVQRPQSPTNVRFMAAQLHGPTTAV